ncbi:uncharacterized protein LTR77_002168 [Saxophila tyrrhenica]|uniref:Protein BIG1 n=1 Tax=Saxophila tyrrhenica TaxID=1690608 RepID=A0AAV9PKK2_9PEZI|nr:hypothetical protein LTR77_002168 [Saxophila tyrrhenica]
MLLPRLGALLLTVTAAQAYKDASPFFLLSSTPLPADAPLKRAQIALASDIENRLIDTLSACDKHHYYIFSQDSVAANDLKDDGMPKLQKSLAGTEEGQFLGIPDLVADGGLKVGNVRTRLEEVCGKKGKKEVDYDAMADTVTSVLGKDGSAVLIYLTTPPHSPSHTGEPYEMDDAYPSAPHTELKRDFEHHARQSDDEDMQAGLPLFEKYQFLSPPIFMGLSVTLLLLAILSVGLRAISGLEVSYFAFSKEMSGQGSQKKQQ